MEPKKNPAYDVHRYRSALFTVGLMTSIAIVIMAFEWKAEVTIPLKREYDPPPVDLVYTITPTEHVYSNKAKLKPVSIALTFDEVKEELADPMDEIHIEEIPFEGPTSPIMPTIEVPVEPFSDAPVIFAEVMPEPESGYSGFYNLLRKGLKYPKKAQQQRIEGKVFVQFIVNEQGNLSDLKVIQGIGSGCDEEAIRVLKLTKWKPGKQRGKPVKVKMVLPIHFKLNPQ